LRSVRAAPELADLLRREGAPVLDAVTDALVAIGEPSVAAVLPVLADGGAARDRAGIVLATLGPVAAPAARAVIAAFKGQPSTGANILGKIGPAAVPAMIEALQSEAEGLRLVAASGLGVVRGQAAAIPALLDALESRHPRVRLLCSVALGWMEVKDSARLVPALLEHLATDSDLEVRAAAASALGRLPAQDLLAVDLLVRKVRDSAEAWRVRGSALSALGMIGPGARAIIPTCTSILAARDETLLFVACFAVEGIGPEGFEDELLPLLEGVLKDKSVGVSIRGAAAGALGTFATRVAAVIPILESLAGDDQEHVHVQDRAKEALSRLRWADLKR
jgi:HEAT repeat protein